MGLIMSPFYVIDEAQVTHGKKADLLNPSKYDANSKILIAKNGGVNKTKTEIRDSTSGTLMTDLSLMGADANDSAMKMHLEVYDKAQDEAALLSENIVEIYNKINEFKVDQAYKIAKANYDKLVKSAVAGSTEQSKAMTETRQNLVKAAEQGLGSLVSMCNYMINLCDRVFTGMSEDKIKKYILSEAFIETDDPNVARSIIQGRIAYNNAMVTCFKTMLNQNYNVLGISKAQAELLSSKLDSGDDADRKASIKEIKAILKNNEKKFVKSNMVDMRPLGGGCFFITGHFTGLEDFTSIDKMIQLSLEYDAIILAHGDSATTADADAYFKQNDTKDEICDREENKYLKTLKELGDKSNSATTKAYSNAVKDIIAKYEKLIDKCDKDREEVLQSNLESESAKKYDELRDKLIKDFGKSIDDLADAFKYDTETYSKAKEAKSDYDKNTKEYIANIDKTISILDKRFRENYGKVESYSNDKTWIMQPVNTLNGGPFTNMDDCVRQLIKEGFKNILIMACNPGHHTLAKDILDHKDVKIHHSENSTLLETSSEDPFNNTLNTLNETENHLISMCESAGYSYDDFIINENISAPECILTEATGAGLWEKVKEYAKKAWNFLVGLFKRVIDFFRGIIRKIKEFLSKAKEKNGDTKFKQKIKTSGILIENAAVKEFQVYTWEDLEKSLVSACETISKHIQQLEKEQVENMKKLEQYAEKMEKEHQSSQNESFDSLVNLMFGY